jgi:hypothetical protein
VLPVLPSVFWILVMFFAPQLRPLLPAAPQTPTGHATAKCSMPSKYCHNLLKLLCMCGSVVQDYHLFDLFGSFLSSSDVVPIMSDSVEV